MAYPIHGKVARSEKNGTVIAFTAGWEITAEIDMADISSQGDSWKTALPGMAGWSGKIDAHLTPSNTEQNALLDNLIAAAPGTKLTDMQFNLEDTGDLLSGNIYITSIPIATNIGGVVSVSFNFQGDGALALTIAA